MHFRGDLHQLVQSEYWVETAEVLHCHCDPVVESTGDPLRRQYASISRTHNCYIKAPRQIPNSRYFQKTPSRDSFAGLVLLRMPNSLSLVISGRWVWPAHVFKPLSQQPSAKVTPVYPGSPGLHRAAFLSRLYNEHHFFVPNKIKRCSVGSANSEKGRKTWLQMIHYNVRSCRSRTVGR